MPHAGREASMRRWAIVAAVGLAALLQTRASAQFTTPPLSPPAERGREGPFSKLRKLFTGWGPKPKVRAQGGCAQGGYRDGERLSAVEAAAVKMRRDEAKARSRIVAVQYLATMPCDHSAEAESALLTALRDDAHENVRFEAAKALASGCCRTSRITD